MIELKVKRYVDAGEEYGGPPISYLHMAWIPADPQTTREEYFYLFNEYEGGADTNINPSVGLSNLCLRLRPLNESAVALLSRGAIEVRHDVMASPTGAWADGDELESSALEASGAKRVTSGLDAEGNLQESHWYVPSDVIQIGDLPLSSTDDISQMCRFDIRVTNIAVEDVIGQSFFILLPDSAIPNTDMFQSGAIYDIPVYDSASYDGGGETIDKAETYLDSGILIEVFLMDRDMQELYEDLGIEFTEIL